MLPLKDNIPTDRVPVVTLLLIAVGVVAQLVADGGSLLAAIASALFLWLFGVAMEDAMSRARFLVLALVGAGAAVAIGRAAEPDAVVAGVAAAGTTAAAAGGFLRLYPRGRVVSLLPVPTAFTLHEVPAWAWLIVWVGIVAALALTSGEAGALLGPAAAFVLGALAAPLLAQRRKQVPQTAIAALS